MILLADELQKRLDYLWYVLQRTLQEKNPGISQIDLDTICVTELEIFVADRNQKP